jgi:hypothetical protein
MNLVRAAARPLPLSMRGIGCVNASVAARGTNCGAFSLLGALQPAA